MATPKLFIDYPVEYTQLLRRAVDNPIRIEFPTELEARRFRNHLYAFRQAIRESREGEGVPDDLVLTSPLISFKIFGREVLVYRPKRTSNVKKALDNAREYSKEEEPTPTS